MRNNWRWRVICGALLPAAIQSVMAYVPSSNDSTWLVGDIPMHVKVGDTGVLTDGSNFNTVATTAMAEWNSYLGTVRFVPEIAPEGRGELGNLVNEIYFDSTFEGQAFGSGVLAVTLIYTKISINQFEEGDIVFNTAFAWDSYRGDQQPAARDFKRVLLHELGHQLGLGHSDAPAAEAVMHANISDLDHLAADDIAGGQSLYRAAGDTSPPANDYFSNATNINVATDPTQIAGNSYYATKESGEPNHDPGDGVGGASVWWKWTAANYGRMTITTRYSHFDTLLGIYTGSSVNALSSIGSNDDVEIGIIRYSTMTFNASAGTTYYIAVDGWKDADDPTAAAETGLIKLNLSFTVGDNLYSWFADYFDESERLDANISGSNADPDGDGLTNLVEYALGLDPKSTDTAGLPEVSTTDTDWVYTYTRPTDRADLTYEVEVSTNLTAWTITLTPTYVSTSDGNETWQATYPLSTAANAFFRVKITTN